VVGAVNYNDSDIARVVHGVNGLLQEINGEEHRQPPWEELDREGRARVLGLVRCYRSGASPRQAHERWRSEMAAEGWAPGEERSYRALTHPNLVPFDELPPRQRVKDRMSQQVVMVMVLGDRL
jgi:hypothetical protein